MKFGANVSAIFSSGTVPLYRLVANIIASSSRGRSIAQTTLAAASAPSTRTNCATILNRRIRRSRACLSEWNVFIRIRSWHISTRTAKRWNRRACDPDRFRRSFQSIDQLAIFAGLTQEFPGGLLQQVNFVGRQVIIGPKLLQSPSEAGILDAI